MAHAGFVRSPHAHATVVSIDLAGALAIPGVAGAFTAEYERLSRPAGFTPMPPDLRGHGTQPLARDRVRFVGEPVAVVLADDPYLLADAIEAVEVEYNLLEPALDVEGEGPSIWDDAPGNVA